MSVREGELILSRDGKNAVPVPNLIGEWGDVDILMMITDNRTSHFQS